MSDTARGKGRDNAVDNQITVAELQAKLKLERDSGDRPPPSPRRKRREEMQNHKGEMD